MKSKNIYIITVLTLLLCCKKELIYPTNCIPTKFISNKSESYVNYNIDNLVNTYRYNSNVSKFSYFKDTIENLNLSEYNKNSEIRLIHQKVKNILIEQIRFELTKDTFLSNYYIIGNNRIISKILKSTNGIDTLDKMEYTYNIDNTLKSIESTLFPNSYFEYYNESTDLYNHTLFYIINKYFKFDVNSKLIKSEKVVNPNKIIFYKEYFYIKDTFERVKKIVTLENNVFDTTIVKYGCEM